MRHAHSHPPPISRTAPIAGTSITAMFASGRSRGASAIRMTLIRGNGIAGSIPAAIPANVQTTPPQRSTRPALISDAHGPSSYIETN
jgi:hypothetical protein